jgi:hypothetical protein
MIVSSGLTPICLTMLVMSSFDILVVSGSFVPISPCLSI